MTKTPPQQPVSMSLRIDGAVQRGCPVRFRVDGRTLIAFEGESVAAALFAIGMRELRHSPRDAAPRGLFCMMGSCQECLVWVGDRKVCACQLAVSAALDIETLAHRDQRAVG